VSSPLDQAWSTTLGSLLGPTGIGEDAGIMVAQLERAARILAHPPIATGALFQTEPAGYYAMLDAHAAKADAT
jgi:hypothetical protein